MDTSKLLAIFQENPEKEFTMGELMHLLQTEQHRATIHRHLQALVHAQEITMEGDRRTAKYKRIASPKNYFSVPFYQRHPVPYDKEFLTSYDEREHPFFTAEESNYLLGLNEPQLVSTGFLLENKRMLENLLIDFAYTSSYLEGNTYSHLDTQVLIQYGEEAEGKAKEEAIMIMDHKRALEYAIEQRKETTLTKRIIFDIHSLLGKELLDAKHLGKLRDAPVKISGSTYSPPQHKHELEDAMEIFLKKYNSIHNPFEQSFFVLVYVPYLQMFHDINKRTGRTLANLPLLRENLAPFTYLGTDRKE